MSDLYSQWLINFKPQTVLEVKGIYYIKRERQSFFRDSRDTLNSVRKPTPLKGLSASHLKCTLLFHYNVEDWPSRGISVKTLGDVFTNTLLVNGFLKMQTETTFWKEFRIRSLDNMVSREQCIVIPLYECVGTAAGISKNNRAFRFQIYEKFMKNSKSLHVRGVDENLALYGTDSSISGDLKEVVQRCESLLVNPMKMEVNGGGLVLAPGRLSSTSRKTGGSKLIRIQACFGAGVYEMPEVVSRQRKSTDLQRRR